MNACRVFLQLCSFSLIVVGAIMAINAMPCSATAFPPIQSTVYSWLWGKDRRGGGAAEPDDISNNQKKQSTFWDSLGALWELSAEAKETAINYGQPPTNNGGQRGGALTVAKSQKQRFFLLNMSPPKFMLLTTSRTAAEEPLEPKREEQPVHTASVSGVTQLWWSNIRESLYGRFEMDATEDGVAKSEVLSKETVSIMALGRRAAMDNDATAEQRMENSNNKKKKRNDPVQNERGSKSSAEETSFKHRTSYGDERLATEDPIFAGSDGTRNDKSDTISEPALDEEKLDTVQETKIGENLKRRKSGKNPPRDLGPAIVVGETSYTSAGAWGSIDKVLSLGLSRSIPQLRLSRHLRPLRKALAKATGLHGVLSGKPKMNTIQPEQEMEILDEEDLGIIRRRIAAIERARKSVELKQEIDAANDSEGRGLFGRRRKVEDGTIPTESDTDKEILTIESQGFQPQEGSSDEGENRRRQERVTEIDKLIVQGQHRLQELACEKDALQRRPNPLYNYTTTGDAGDEVVKFSRTFSFPSETLVEDYLDDLFAHGRLIKMNHTHLWKSGVGFDDDEDESIGDDLLTPSADASRLYSEFPRRMDLQDRRNGNGGGGSWLLRQSIGKGGSLGEKIGETAEIAGYKAVCTSVMSSLARLISAIHGMSIMAHSDVRLFMEQVPDLPPISRAALPRKDYAEEAIKGAMLKSQKRKKKHGLPKLSDDDFLQRDAIVETLLSHCQISAPLLKLFPLAWQRALLANMITLITHVISDFAEGIELQILGHALTFSFKPITESDMIRHIGLADKGMNHRKAKPEEFEEAVRATAEDLSQALKILDRWHERALGSGMLRAQIANLIARLVLTLADEVLSGARMDLWAAQAGGPRVLLGLEYRTASTPLQEGIVP